MDKPNIEQIRRRMLTIARINEQHYTGGFVPSRLFELAKDDSGVQVASAQEQVEWLCDVGVLEERVNQKMGGTITEFRHRSYRLTRKGWMLWVEEIQPIPGIADQRLGDAL